MSESVERLLIRIDATTEQMRRELKAAENAVAKTDKKVRTAQQKMAAGWAKADKAVQKHGKKLVALGAIAMAGLAVAINKVIKNTSAQDKAMAQLEATIKSTGGAAGKTAIELAGTAAALQKITVFGDETIIGAQSLIATFKNIKGDQFDRTTVAVLDMATAMGTDLKSAAIMVGKALNDPKTQMSALSRSGITFTETQKDMVNQMQAAGDMAGAQALILRELESQFEGSAEAARNTLGGALQGLSNSFNDLFEVSTEASGGMVDAVNELDDVMNDPSIKKGMAELSAGLISFAASALEGVMALKFFYNELNGLVGGEGNEPLIGDLIVDLMELENELIALEKPGKGFFDIFGHKKQKDIKETKKKIKELSEEIENHSFTVQRAAEKEAALAAATEEVTEAAVEATEVSIKSQKEINKENKLREAAKKKVDGVKIALDFQLAQLKRNDRQQAIHTALQKADITATDDSAAAIMAKAGALYDLQLETDAAAQAVVDAAEKTEAATEAAVEAAEAAVEPFNAALQEMAASIDSGFVDGWRDAFNGVEGGFKNFAAKMKDALINLLANMAHMAITRPITIAMTTAMGGLMPATAGASVPGAGGISSLFSGGIGAMGQGAYEGIGTFASNMGMTGFGDMAYTKGLNTSGLSMAGDFAGGLAGSYLGSKAFGETSGIGSTVGGIAGSIAIPIPVLGAAIGSFIGSGIESLFSGDNDGDNRGRSSFDLATGTFNTRGEGKSFNQANVDNAGELTAQLAVLAQAIGGSTASGEVAIGNNSGLAYAGRNFGEDVDGFFEAAFRDIIDSAVNLDDAVKLLVKGFDGGAEDLGMFVGSLQNIYDATKTNPVDEALADMVASVDASSRTMLETYGLQVVAVNELITGYDGSLTATVDLNAALQSSRAMAFELAIAIMQMSDAIGTMLGNQVEYFREAIMTEEELTAARIANRAAVLEELKNTSDPEEVMRLVGEFAALNKQIFDNLTEEQQAAQIEIFASFAEEVDNIAQSILGTALTDLQLSQEEINAKLVADVTKAGDTMQVAANNMSGAVSQFGGLVSQLVSQGININVTTTAAEVNR